MSQSTAHSQTKLPVTIITGFLGSGKTTLLNHILTNHQDLKVAVLVNELGDIDIDSQLLVTVDQNMIELSNGCICCSINTSLAEAVYGILERRAQIDCLVIETTGVADPLPIALTFLGTDLRDMTWLDSLLTVVDAETFTPGKHYNSDAALSQIEYSDIILLNKTDLVAEAKIDELQTYLRSIKSGARILPTKFGNVPLSLILDVNLSGSGSSPLALAAPTPESSINHLQNDGFMTVSFQGDRPFSIRLFQQFLDYQLPENVFRAKGVLWFVESPARHIFQLSGKRFTIDDSEWITAPKNEMVLIGRKLDPLFLQQALNNCLTR
ncbi:MAG: GTP-binding protein [Aphanocapsa sp. GSE-SYN-MK-11-07L]|jgi:G3E family GTPase|nr:GTP-binding protein [Aphanocapsa sp. GSE-SYN-MK-11-07L]